jgi:GT2 family glycosyltransferase
VVRRAAFEQVGGFDERLFMYAEDVDLSYKLAPLGRLVIVDEAHFPHDWPHKLSYANEHRVFRNNLVVNKRHRNAYPVRMLRDAFYSFRRGDFRTFAARTTGTLDYLMRARRWA